MSFSRNVSNAFCFECLGASAVACGLYGAPALLVALYARRSSSSRKCCPFYCSAWHSCCSLSNASSSGGMTGALGISIGGGAESSANLCGSRPNGSSPEAMGGRRNQSLQSHESREQRVAAGRRTRGDALDRHPHSACSPEIPAQNQLSHAPNVESPRSNTTGSTTSTNCLSGKKKRGDKKTVSAFRTRWPTSATIRCRRRTPSARAA